MTSVMMSYLYLSVMTASPDFLGPSATDHAGIVMLWDVVKLGQNDTGTCINKDY